MSLNIGLYVFPNSWDRSGRVILMFTFAYCVPEFLLLFCVDVLCFILPWLVIPAKCFLTPTLASSINTSRCFLPLLSASHFTFFLNVHSPNSYSIAPLPIILFPVSFPTPIPPLLPWFLIPHPSSATSFSHYHSPISHSHLLQVPILQFSSSLIIFLCSSAQSVFNAKVPSRWLGCWQVLRHFLSTGGTAELRERADEEIFWREIFLREIFHHKKFHGSWGKEQRRSWQITHFDPWLFPLRLNLGDIAHMWGYCEQPIPITG